MFCWTMLMKVYFHFAEKTRFSVLPLSRHIASSIVKSHLLPISNTVIVRNSGTKGRQSRAWLSATMNAKKLYMLHDYPVLLSLTILHNAVMFNYLLRYWARESAASPFPSYKLFSRQLSRIYVWYRLEFQVDRQKKSYKEVDKYRINDERSQLWFLFLF